MAKANESLLVVKARTGMSIYREFRIFKGIDVIIRFGAAFFMDSGSSCGEIAGHAKVFGSPILHFCQILTFVYLAYNSTLDSSTASLPSHLRI